MKVRVILGILAFTIFFTYQLTNFNIFIVIVAINHEELANNNTSQYYDAKAVILGAFYYLSWVTELSGAYLLTKFGCRNVMSVTFALNVISCFLFPVLYYVHPILAALIRVIQGFIWGTTWPTVAWISSRWIPKEERSRFMTCHLGTSFGATCANFFGGIISQSLGWPYVFYCNGLISLVLLLFWWPYASDSPLTNSRISKEERDYLEKNVEANIAVKQEKPNVPWIKVATSVPFWAIFSTFFALIFFLITMGVQMPMYFDTVFPLDIKTIGLLLSIVGITRVTLGLYVPVIIDSFVKRKILSIYNARRLSAGLGMLLPGIFTILLGYYGPVSVELATILTVLSVSVNGIAVSSILANVVDISPNHAGSIMGFLKLTENVSGVLAPLLLKFIFRNDVNNWPKVFLIIGITAIIGNLFYLSFTSTEIQPWDKLGIKNVDSEEKEDEKSLRDDNINDENL